MTPAAPAPRSSAYPLLAWLVVALACALRLLHVYFTGRFDPLAGDLQLDAATYDRWARAIVSGGDAGPTTLMQAPLYPWFLSAIYRLAGPGPEAVRFVQALLGTATCGLVILCARRLFDSRPAALLAGLFAALYGPLIFYEGLLLPAALIVFLNVLFVAIVVSGERPGAARLFVAGLVLGAAAAANPPTAILGLFALLHLGLGVGDAAREAPRGAGAGRPAGAHPGRRFAAGALALALGGAAAISPATIVNSMRAGGLVPLTTGAGINFYLGANPAANGYYQVPVYKGRSLGGTPEEQAVNMAQVAESESGKALSPSEVSAFWTRAGFAFIREEPRAWGALLWNKFRYFWNVYERANVESYYFHRRFPGVLSLPLLTFGFVAPLGLLGVFLTRARSRRLWLAYGGILTYLFVALAFYVLARYRVPVVPFLAMFAGAAAVELYDLGRRRRFAELGLSLAALALLAFFSDVPAAKDTPGGIASAYARLGGVYLTRGDAANAERAFREALARDQGNDAARRGLDIIREKTGKRGGLAPQESRGDTLRGRR